MRRYSPFLDRNRNAFGLVSRVAPRNYGITALWTALSTLCTEYK